MSASNVKTFDRINQESVWNNWTTHFKANNIHNKKSLVFIITNTKQTLKLTLIYECQKNDVPPSEICCVYEYRILYMSRDLQLQWYKR
jgi:hypothetical protein